MRMTAEEMKTHPLRQEILKVITERPGITIKALRQHFAGEMGAAGITYHLYCMEKAKMIKSVRITPHRHLYLYHLAVKDLPKSTEDRILAHITANPRCYQRQIADALSMKFQVVSYHVRNMIASGRLKVEMCGSATLLTVKEA